MDIQPRPINSLSALAGAHYYPIAQAYFPTLAEAAAKFRAVTNQEPGEVLEYTTRGMVGDRKMKTWYFRVSKEIK